MLKINTVICVWWSLEILRHGRLDAEKKDDDCEEDETPNPTVTTRRIAFLGRPGILFPSLCKIACWEEGCQDIPYFSIYMNIDIYSSFA